MTEKKIFKTEKANKKFVVGDWIYNEARTIEEYDNIYRYVEALGQMPPYKYNCATCNANLRWALFFNHKDSAEEVRVGGECAQLLTAGNDYEAQLLATKKRVESAKQRFEWNEKVKEFKTEYPILYQGAEHFKDFDFVIQNIFNSIKYGLTEKQIAYLTKLILEAWEKQVAIYKAELTPKTPAPKLKAGVHELEVTISNYYLQEKGYYYVEKAVFETEAGQTIFTGKTKQLIQYLQVDLDLFEEDYGIDAFWKLDKKERKSYLTHEKVHFDKYTKGILKVELGDEFAEDKYGGKILDFTPTFIKEKKDYFNAV